MSQKKVLVLGATGAMGKYLVPELASKGYQVDAVAIDDYEFGCKVNFIKSDAYDFDFRAKILRNNYDAIVDFLMYPTRNLVLYLPDLLEATDHYIYLSTYRIYDGVEVPVKETSPRLIDSSKDVLLKNSDDYCIHKARGENVLNGWSRKNWTIIRPAVTYSLMRYQLVTLEAAATLARARAGKSVVLPESARNVQGTMSWAGDVAKMISCLIFNERALGEVFTVATAEHHSWGEIADYYKDICGLNAVWVDQEDFLKVAVNNFERFPYSGSWQLVYDRLFDRVMDNSKILEVTGLEQKNMMKLYDGLKYEIGRCPENFAPGALDLPLNIRMDEYLQKKGLV